MNKTSIIKVRDVIKYFLIIILLLYLLFIAYQKIVNKSNPAIFNKYYIFQVVSRSMENTLKKGDYILVKKSNDYKINDIVTYKENNSFITHRIKKISQDNIITKGDNNNIEDAPIKQSDIVGVYILKLNIIGFFIKYKIPIILVLLLCIICCKKKVRV